MNSKTLLVLCILVGFLHYGESGKAGVVKITDSNWSQTLEGKWLIKFYAPWCPACKAISPTWQELSDWSQELDTKIAEVDVTEEPGLSGRFLVTSLPTIYHATEGVFRRYMGPRDKDDLISLIEEQKYEEIEPLSWWQAPSSVPMAIMAWVFKMSMLVRVTHTILTEEYGFPAWSSYGFFAVITVMLGLLLGTILVFIADFIWPVKGPRGPQRPRAPPPRDANRKDRKKEEEEEEEKEEENIDGGSEVSGDQTVRKRKTESEADKTS